MSRTITRPTGVATIVLVMVAGCSRTPDVPGRNAPAQPARSEAETLYRDGARLLESDPAKAIELLTRSLERNPDAPPALYNRASAYARVGRDAEALADVDRLEAVAPDVGRGLRARMRLAAGPYTSLAEEAYKAKDYALAIKKCDSALAYDPEWGDAWVVKGLAFQALGDAEKALASFDKGAEVEPGNFFVFINRAELHQEAGRLQQALADFTKAIELQPEEPDGYSGRSGVYEALKMPEKAAEDRTKVEGLRATGGGPR